MLRRSIDKHNLPSINTSPSQLPERYASTNHGQHGMIRHTPSNENHAKSPQIKRLYSAGGALSRPKTPTSPTIRKAFSMGDTDNILSAPILKGDPNSASNVIATKKAEYTKSRLICEYLQFYCEVVHGSMSMDAIQSLFADPIIITELNPHIIKLMDMFEKFIRHAGFSDILQWFDSVVSRGDHSLIGLIPYTLFSAELLILTIGSGNAILEERDVRTLFCHLNDSQSIDVHLSRNSLHVAYKMKRISLKNARRLNSIAKLVKNIHFIMKNTQTTLQDYRKINHSGNNKRYKDEIKNIGVVELEQVLCSILSQYSAVLNGDAPQYEERSLVVPNTRGSFMFNDITQQDLTPFGIQMLSSPSKPGESPEPESSPIHRTLSRVSYSPFTQSLDDIQGNTVERPTNTAEDDDFDEQGKNNNNNNNNNNNDVQTESELINENYAQFFDAEERRLLHNLVKHMQEGEKEGDHKLPTLPRTTIVPGSSSFLVPNGNNTGTSAGIRPMSSRATSAKNHERRNSIMRKTQIKNHLKSFNAYVEQQEIHKHPEPIQSEQPMFTLFGEAPLNSSSSNGNNNNNHGGSGVNNFLNSMNGSSQSKTKRGGLTIDEIIQKNLDNLTGHKSHHHHHHHHNNNHTTASSVNDRRPKTSQGLMTSAPPTIQLNGCSLPSHEKILQTFDNRLEFVRTSMNRYR